jgi:hypothetical protein
MNIRELIDQEAAAAEDAELMEDDHAPLPEGTRVTRGHNRSKTLQIRLNGDEYGALELLAKNRDLPVSTVARALILNALALGDDAQAAFTRVEHDIANLRRIIGKA